MAARTAMMRPSLVDTWLREPVVRRWIGLGLLGFTLVTALLVTLSPFDFHLRTASLSRIDWRLYYPGHSDRDLVLNLLMLAPLGAGLALVRAGRAAVSRIALEACALGVGTALVIEALQIFQRTRFPQAADVWRNGTGCIVGAVVVALVLQAIDRRRESSLSAARLRSARGSAAGPRSSGRARTP
jgi:glycopeptide antibiotics resistance protein